MKIGIANDHSAVDMKKQVVEYLVEKGYEVVNYGTDSYESCPYPKYGEKIGKALQTEKWISELQSVEPVLEFPWQPIRFTVSAQRCVLNHIRQRWQENIIMQM